MEKSRFSQLVDGLVQSYGEQEHIIKFRGKAEISRVAVIKIIESLQALVFPGFFGRKNIAPDTVEYYAGDLLEEVQHLLSAQIMGALRHCAECDHPGRNCFTLSLSPGVRDETLLRRAAEQLCDDFLAKLPEARALLASDVDATFEGDPAAFDRNEIISSYPGIFAITVYRLAHILYEKEIPLIPRIMSEYAHSKTGIDIHPGALIGHHFMIDHGTGVVIGQTTVIGNYVKIYQGVTLGGLSTRGGQELRGVKRHPTIEDRVTIYSGASILGGETVIGAESVIGGNAFITKPVPPRTRVSMTDPDLNFTHVTAQ
jgi:serine O-acetyltransferase